MFEGLLGTFLVMPNKSKLEIWGRAQLEVGLAPQVLLEIQFRGL